MKHRCSKCGHVDEIKLRAQAKGGRSRWEGMSKEERSAEMKRVRNAALVGKPSTKPHEHYISSNSRNFRFA